MSVSAASRVLTVAISGSRTLTKRDPVFKVLDERAIYYFSLGYLLHLHCGDAQGIDYLAIEWARDRQIADSVTIFFANPQLVSCFDARPNEQVIVASSWDLDGLGAGNIRNSAMLSGTALNGDSCRVPGCRGADLLWAIRNRLALNRGTDNAISQATARNIPVQSYTVGDPDVTGWIEWLA